MESFFILNFGNSNIICIHFVGTLFLDIVNIKYFIISAIDILPLSLFIHLLSYHMIGQLRLDNMTAREFLHLSLQRTK